MSVVRENPEGVSYTSLGGVILPVDLESGQVTGAAVAARESRAADKRSEAIAEVLAGRLSPNVTQPIAKPQQGAGRIGPREVVRAARARIKEIKSELKHHSALKRELAELERLVAAAKKPLATVRELRRSG